MLTWIKSVNPDCPDYDVERPTVWLKIVHYRRLPKYFTTMAS